jgi:hypothetical protein
MEVIMFTITHATLDQQGATKSKWNKKFVSVFYMGLIMATILSVNRANATIATTESASRVVVTKQANSVSFDLCSYHFNFEQRMIINGQLMMILTTQENSPGPHDLLLIETCDGYNIYQVSSGNSLTIDFPNPSITNNAENTSTEITKPGPMQLITTHKTAGFLWIRKER